MNFIYILYIDGWDKYNERNKDDYFCVVTMDSSKDKALFIEPNKLRRTATKL